MLTLLRSSPDSLSAAHARIASFVLDRPEEAVKLSIADLARETRVSEPTVIRFCRRFGCDGYKSFRLNILRELAEEGRLLPDDTILAGDSVEDGAAKSFAATIRSLDEVRRTLPFESIRHAAVAILKARWVHIYGFGASATVAADAQHKLFRLAAMTVAYSDAHMQAMAAATLGPEDVLIAISASGETRELIETAKLAQENGVTIVALAKPRSPLGDLSSILLPLDLKESREIYTPMTVRMAQLAVIDALVVGVTLLSPPTVVSERFARMDVAIKRRRISAAKNSGDIG